MNYVKLTKDSFVRNYKENGYITNQLTKLDALFNDTGADFLSVLSKTPVKINELIVKLLLVYTDVSKDEISPDFKEFLVHLESEGFVVTGESPDECFRKEPSFSYKNDYVKTNIRFFSDDFKSGGTEEYIRHNLHKEYRLSNIYLEVTRRCNERCIHCYIPNYQKDNGADMSVEDAKRYIDEAVELGLLSISITGGECFMNKDIDKILLYAREKDLMISILSNLTLIEEHHIPMLKEVNPSLIQVSIYSMDATTHDKITELPGSFEKSMKSIRLFLENDIPVQISCPVMKQNYSHYKDVLKWADTHKIKAYTDLELSGQTDYNTDNLNNMPSYEQSKQVLKDMLEEDKEWQRVLLTEYAKGVITKRDPEEHLCGVGVDILYIAADGGVYPCGTWQGYKIGDLKNDTIKNIWDNNSQIKHLRALRLKDFPNYWESELKEFMSICPARNANANNGDYMTINQREYDVAKMTKELVDEFIAKNKEKLT